MFFVDAMVKDPKRGWLISGPSNSPEQGGLVIGPTMDHQIVRSLFGALIAASQTLDVDPELRTPSKDFRYPHRILVPVRGHRYEYFSGADIDPGRMRLQNRTVLQAHPFSPPTLLSLLRFTCLAVLRTGLCRMLLLPGHVFSLFLPRRRPSRAIEGTLLIRNQPAALHGL